MLGFRLRYQIAGFIFVLFTCVILLMAYFNITILSDQLQRLSIFKAAISAENLFGLFRDAMGVDEESLGAFIIDSQRFQSFLRYGGTVANLRKLELFNAAGESIFSNLKKDIVSVDDASFVIEAMSGKKTVAAMWAVDLISGKGELIQKYGTLDPRLIINDYFFPVIRKGQVLGVMRVSFTLDKSSTILRIFFLGNISLSMVFILTAFFAIYLWSENAINRPIRNLLRAQERLSHGDFDVHVDLDLPSNNELAVIASSFNKMARELKIFQERLTEQTSKLEELNRQYRSLNENLEGEVESKTRELREFFSLITHDLKIPLAAIKGYIDLLRKSKTGALSDKQLKFVNSIDTATTHLLSMVRNMLDTVRYEGGKVEFITEDFSLLDLVREVEEHLIPMLGEKSIRFNILIPPECRMVHADRAKIGQVLANVLANGINYTPDKGEITITAEEEGDMVEIRVRDTGIGIPPEQLERIFEKFQQIPGKESSSTSLGLGLYIVKIILEGHGMKVWAKSTEGKGSSFYFTLEKSIKKRENAGHEQDGKEQD